MFPPEYIKRAQCTWTSCSVTLWSDLFHCRYISNLPSGVVARAYWIGNNVYIEMRDGWRYVYEDFENYSSRWR